MFSVLPSYIVKMELVDLYDSVLLNIFERLELPELCALNASCRRLQSIARLVAQQRYKYVDYVRLMHRYSNFCEVPCDTGFRSAMEFIGPYVQRLYLNGNYIFPFFTYSLLKTLFVCFSLLGELLNQHFRSMMLAEDAATATATDYEDRYEHSRAVTVGLKDFPRFEKLMPLIGRYFTNLSCIRLDFEPSADWTTVQYIGQRALHSEGFRVDDRRLSYIFNYWPVDELSVSHPDMYKAPGGLEWNTFNGKCFADMENVKRLVLRHCNKVMPQNFHTFCLANAEYMVHLELTECVQLNESAIVFTHISRNLFNLTHLDVSFKDDSPSLESLTELDKLRYLRLNMASDIDRLMENLAINDRIDHLHIDDCLIDFTSDGFSEDHFFTHLQTVTLGGNMLDARALQRFGNASSLREIRFSYEMELESGLLELVRLSCVLTVLDMYCTEWINVSTVERIVDILRTTGATADRPRLQLKLAYELYDEKDRYRLEKLSKDMEVFGEKHADVILITQLIPNIY